MLHNDEGHLLKNALETESYFVSFLLEVNVSIFSCNPKETSIRSTIKT